MIVAADTRHLTSCEERTREKVLAGIIARTGIESRPGPGDSHGDAADGSMVGPQDGEQ